MNHDATHCADFCADCPMKCYRAELEVDLRSKWTKFIGVPLSYAHLYGTEECMRDPYHKESEEKEMSKIRSREDETYSTLCFGQFNTDTTLHEIAMSLGRIADMLTEANGYIVEYDSENEGNIREKR